jgi:ComEC/Rec2-related protein
MLAPGVWAALALLVGSRLDAPWALALGAVGSLFAGCAFVARAPLVALAAVVVALVGVGGHRAASQTGRCTPFIGHDGIATTGRSFDGIARIAEAIPKGPHRLSVDWVTEAGTLQATVGVGDAVRALPDWRPGGVFRVRGHTDCPHGPRNPGEPDFRALLASEGIDARLHLDAAPEPAAPSDAGAPASAAVSGLFGHVFSAAVAEPVHDLRAAGLLTLDRFASRGDTPSTEGAGVLRAILLGDGSELGPALRESYRRFGLTHLLVVSGMHLVVTVWVLARLLRTVLLRAVPRWSNGRARAASAALAITLVGPYTLLTGDGIATRRAAAVALLAGAAIVLRRPSRVMNLMGWAAAIELSVNPAVQHSASFQLSYAAAVGLVVIGPPLWNRLDRLRASVGGVVGIVLEPAVSTVAATVATLPIQWWTFQQVSLAGLASNLVAVPLMTFWVMPVGYTGLLTGSDTVLAWAAAPLPWLHRAMHDLAPAAEALSMDRGTVGATHRHDELAVTALALPAGFAAIVERPDARGGACTTLIATRGIVTGASIPSAARVAGALRALTGPPHEVVPLRRIDDSTPLDPDEQTAAYALWGVAASEATSPTTACGVGLSPHRAYARFAGRAIELSAQGLRRPAPFDTSVVRPKQTALRVTVDTQGRVSTSWYEDGRFDDYSTRPPSTSMQRPVK